MPALESKLANAATVMRDMGLLPLKARDSVGGLVRAEDDEPPTPRRAVSGMVRKLRGSDVGLVDGMEVDETED